MPCQDRDRSGTDQEGGVSEVITVVAGPVGRDLPGFRPP